MDGYAFRDREDAGRTLAGLLRHYRGRDDVIVLGLPRGGVPVAYEISVALGAPLDVFVVRKLGLPGHEEFAMGAIASGGVIVVNDDVVRDLGISDRAVQVVAQEEGRELGRREREYREARPMEDVTGKVVILVDDGLATGSTMRAAIVALRRLAPARIVVAVPAAPRSACRGTCRRGGRGHLRDDALAILCGGRGILGLRPDIRRPGTRSPARRRRGDQWPECEAGTGATMTQRYSYAVDKRYLPLLVPLGFRGSKDGVTLTDDASFLATFGFLKLATPLANVTGAHVTRGYRWWTAFGIRGSMVDDGLTLGTNHALACASTLLKRCRRRSAEVVTPH